MPLIKEQQVRVLDTAVELTMGDVGEERMIFLMKCSQCCTTEEGGQHETKLNLHGLSGWKMGRPLTSLTKMPARTKASPEERIL